MGISRIENASNVDLCDKFYSNSYNRQVRPSGLQITTPTYHPRYQYYVEVRLNHSIFLFVREIPDHVEHSQFVSLIQTREDYIRSRQKTRPRREARHSHQILYRIDINGYIICHGRLRALY